MWKWRLQGRSDLRWRKLGERKYLGEADNETVRVAKRKRQCARGCEIPKGQPYVDYWMIGDKHSDHCLKHAPLAVEVVQEYF